MPCRYRRSRLPRRRRKAKQRARDKGRTASQKTLSLSGLGAGYYVAPRGSARHAGGRVALTGALAS